MDHSTWEYMEAILRFWGKYITWSEYMEAILRFWDKYISWSEYMEAILRFWGKYISWSEYMEAILRFWVKYISWFEYTEPILRIWAIENNKFLVFVWVCVSALTLSQTWSPMGFAFFLLLLWWWGWVGIVSDTIHYLIKYMYLSVWQYMEGILMVWAKHMTGSRYMYSYWDMVDLGVQIVFVLAHLWLK